MPPCLPLRKPCLSRQDSFMYEGGQPELRAEKKKKRFLEERADILK